MSSTAGKSEAEQTPAEASSDEALHASGDAAKGTDAADEAASAKTAVATPAVADEAASADSAFSDSAFDDASGDEASELAVVGADAELDTSSSSDAIAPGTYTIVPACSQSRALDVEGASLSNMAGVRLWQANGTPAQQWTVAVDGDGWATITCLASGKALDVCGAKAENGSAVWQYEANGTAAQRWKVVGNGDGTYTLRSALGSDMVLDVAGGIDADGSQVQIWQQNGTAAQSWELAPVETLVADGMYSLKTLAGTGGYVDIDGCSSEHWANAQVWSGNGSPAQKFKVANQPDGSITLEALCSGRFLADCGDTVRQVSGGASEPECCWVPEPSDAGGVALRNAKTGRVLDVAGAGSWDGCDVRTWEANGTAAQAFSFQPTPVLNAGTYEVVCASDGLALDVDGGARGAGANVQVWDRNGTGAQKWVVNELGDGWYSLVNCRSGKALDVDSWGTEPGTNVQQWYDNGVEAQRWRAEYAGGGCYRFVSACGGLVLDVAGGGGYNGANVQTYTANGSPAQGFRMVPTSYTPPVTGAVQRGDGSWDWYNDNGDWDRQGAIDKILSTANSLLGVPYVWLGVYPQDGGMDCASFTWYLYRQLGIEIGFETYDQMYSGVPVWSLSDAKPGDLILMYDNGWPNYTPGLFEHVVLYAGDGMIYEEPTFGGQCQYVSIWSKGMGNISIRRILGD